MKKCVVIPDSFKGTLSSTEICQIARGAIARYFPECEVVTIPVADGGEGTVACFAQAMRVEQITVPVSGPYGERVQATYARRGKTAIIEMASAAGLPLTNGHCDPEQTTTFGVGELIGHAVDHGCEQIILGLGGSATNDGGCGCAAALGVRFLDRNGQTFVPTGGTLERIAAIDCGGIKERFGPVCVSVMCDVENPLCGPAGAAHVFAWQKGADAEMVERLDSGLRWLGEIMERDLHCSVAEMPGAGAAGGMGAGCVAFLGAELKSGIETILDVVGFNDVITGSDLVITGEGRIDSQSIHGKVISGIAKRTAAKGVPLLALVGSIHPSAVGAYDLGVTAMFSINREPEPLEVSAPKSRENYQKTLEDILRLIRAAEEMSR